MNILALALALFILINVLDRLRLVNWRTAKSLVIVAYLVQAAWSLWALYDVFTSGVIGWQWLGMLACLTWLHVTRPDWRNGVPERVRTRPGGLGDPEPWI